MIKQPLPPKAFPEHLGQDSHLSEFENNVGILLALTHFDVLPTKISFDGVISLFDANSLSFFHDISPSSFT